MKSLLIDIGSTSVKWACYAEQSGKGDVRRVSFPAPYCRKPPFYEVDPEQIWQIIQGIVEQADQVDSLYLSVQMHGYLLGDAAGNLLTPYISWQDERATLPFHGASHLSAYPGRVEPWTGSSLKANLPAVSLFAMQRQQPDIIRRARVFYTLGSYIVNHLTGKNATHLSDAAATGFYDVRTGQPGTWAPDWLQLPRILNVSQQAGAYHGINVFPPIGDQQASVLGSYLEPGAYLLNLGTAAQLCTIEQGYCSGSYESRPFFRGDTLCTVTRLLGGRDIKRLENDAELIDKLIDDYREAIHKLPERRSLVVIGGAAKHYSKVISKVCDCLGLPCIINTEPDALDGLARLAKGDI